MDKTVRAGDDMARRLAFLRIDEGVRQTLRRLKPLVVLRLPAILDGFYGHVRGFQEVDRMFPSDQVRRHARDMQLRHWTLICDAQFDEGYAESVRRVGVIHARLGLEPRWYIGGYGYIVAGLLAAASDAPGSRIRAGRRRRGALRGRPLRGGVERGPGDPARSAAARRGASRPARRP